MVELGSLFLALPLEILCCSASKNAWGMWKTRGSGLPARSQTRGQGLAAERQRAGEGAGVIHLCALLRVWDFHHRSPPSWLQEPCQGLTTREAFPYVFLRFLVFQFASLASCPASGQSLVLPPPSQQKSP